MVVHVATRPVWLAILMNIGIRIRYWLHAVFGLQPFFTQITNYPSKWRPKNCPKYDFWTRISFNFIWVFVGLARDYSIFYLLFCKVGIMNLINRFHEWTSKRLIDQMIANGFTEAQREVEIPEYDWKNGNPEEFYKTFVTRPHPVILRGFMKDTELLKKLNWDTVIEKYGNEDVFLTKKELDGFPGKLREVEDGRIYLHNSEILFTKYPEIRDLFQYERLEPYLHMKVGYEQIFVGKEGTGTPFHHASVYNMFYMVDGSKTWYFVDPYDSYLGYPMAILGRAANFFMCLFPGQYDKEAFPLFQYCPVYKGQVHAGDVLFNPPWWWHAIKNVTPHSVGVASRWHTDGICGQNLTTTEEDYDSYKIGSLLFQMGLGSWSFLHNILQTPSPRFDEHLTLRETKNRFVHKQTECAENKGMEILGVRTKF